MKNAANTNVLLWQGRLFALWEAGRPYELSPETLHTLGKDDLNGVVVHTMTAHPHHVPARNATYAFGVRNGPRCFIDLYELPDHGRARTLGKIRIPGPTMVHDFMATERHLVFFVAPLRMRLLPFVFGRISYVESLAWRPELGTRIYVVPIDAPERVREIEAEPFMSWHFVNGFEQGNDLILDFVRYPDWSVEERIRDMNREHTRRDAGSSLHRAIVTPSKQSVRWEERWRHVVEFPRVSPGHAGQPYRYPWLLAFQDNDDERASLFDRIARFDLERGEAEMIDVGPNRYPGEPVFVPRRSPRDETDGFVLSLVYDADAHASHLAVIDGSRPGDGVVARLWFDHHVPPPLHGAWLPA